MSSWKKNYTKWYDRLDTNLRPELDEMSAEEKEEAFGSSLTFGTAGLRGILGHGTNRMNIQIIHQTTEGLARWIEEQGDEAKERGVAISYDNRHYSDSFAFEAAKVLGQHGIKSYVFEELNPTPVLSFAVRYYQAIAGIMVTASHNPPNYNGFKVYGEDGGQFPPEAAARLTDFINEIESPFDIEVADAEALQAEGTIELVGEEVLAAYLEELKEVTVNPSLAEKVGSDIHFVYSAMHGAGTQLAKKSFDQAGFTNISYVESQCQADPDFSTVKSPNPETEEAFDLSKELAEEVDADVLFATDPDADRLGVCVRTGVEDYTLLSGNQTAALMLDYLVTQSNLPENPALIRSLVSSHLPDAIAKAHGVEVYEVLTGFKFIADKIKEFEKTGSHEMILGFEEAIGYLVKPFVRDKDAFQALVLMAEVAAYHFEEGRNLVDALELIYERYGYYYDRTISVQYPGLSGQETMEKIMTEVRQAQLENIADYDVVKTDDYLTRESSAGDGQIETLDYPSSNVLRYTFEDGGWIALRPSGTEPKIKLYMSAIGESMADAQSKVDSYEQAMRGKIE
ncbi:MAG: phospho-sugar mutase [Atopococcus tabaci]|uniref:Phosphoglucomutase n=1 Tax=Atopococcus tabaci TaxID=269774 RepID=A0AA43UCD7_9LACT|nr:phospho-sugar mutase [Atopococcus tabaci]